MVSSPVKLQKVDSITLPADLLTNKLSEDAGKVLADAVSAGFAIGMLPLPESRLFGTDGIRGRAGELLSAPLALQVGFWAGRILLANAAAVGPVIIGQDSRNSSSMLAMALSAGLTAAGLEVWDLGLCPTPAVAHVTYTSEAIGGVMISASHNPPPDNGIKFFGANGSKLAIALQNQIEAALRGDLHAIAQPSISGWGTHYHRPELAKSYCTAIQATLQSTSDELPLNGMRIVMDLAWGAAVELAPIAFRSLGAEVICLHDQPDGDLINVHCGSTHLGMLQTAVKEHQADLGVAFDGDADRVLAVDNLGRPVDGDYILYLWGTALKQMNQLPGNTIVATVMSNLGFERAWEHQGGKLIRAAVGDQYVHAEMLRHGSILGGEQSGHVLCRHYGVSGDGLLTALHLAQLVKRSSASFADLIDQSFQTFPQKLKNVRVEDRAQRVNWKECEPLMQAIAAAELAMGDQGRVLVRASGTEPLIRVMVEAASEELVLHWTDTLALVAQRHLT
ncbi:phosphoglucosamine mutase [Phormidium sp. CLA17]|uniref:phosphoglucosamine mutase n=1 Tax=Leptolyngbya sp. Cla-17 TaxID=2803751 RepID=UPI001491596C|nr:phosphoglucosamine mutase [Leptolyngbya sp. Cla-17]MBM0742249.1 phosphoglucosamine mutase [Leptolyngbya sp. Cla-17]